LGIQCREYQQRWTGEQSERSRTVCGHGKRRPHGPL
jgi:hypothetical protein